MKIQPEDLPDQGYVLVDKLRHRELVPFVQRYMKKRTGFTIAYYMFNAILFGATGHFFVSGSNDPDYSLGTRFTHFSAGLAIAFVLLPVHEYIHVLAYKSQGATRTSYDANLKKFYFLALADGFVASKQEFQVVALAPFVVITSACILALFVVDQDWILTTMAALLAHTAMCSGDFGLLSYFERHSDRDMVTYDEVATRTSYFYARDKAR